jgi:peroxisomal 2,4-dienoyl-CoA reductase
MGTFSEDMLAGKVALVTGGATGIGKRIAESLGAHGARVFICSRKEENLKTASEELIAAGLSCHYAVADIRAPDQVEAVIDCVVEWGGGLDILINNAAGNFPAPISGISYNGFKTIVDIDLLGTYNVTKAAFEKVMKARGGSIVNITAPFQHGGAAWQAHVGAAKAGVDSLTRTCAVEFGAHGIRVNAVGPGATGDTEGLARFTEATGTGDSTDSGAMAASNPLGFVGSKSDIANAVLFLVSDAARYVTGQLLMVDGGSSVDLLKLGNFDG